MEAVYENDSDMIVTSKIPNYSRDSFILYETSKERNIDLQTIEEITKH